MRKKGYSLFIIFLIFSMVIVNFPGHASAAGALRITSLNGQNVAGQTTTLTISYEPGIQLNLIGSMVFELPAGITAVAGDEFNGTAIPASMITNSGRTITLSGTLLLNLLANDTLTLKTKTLPAAGTYTITAYTKSTLNVTIGESTQQNTFTVLAATPAPTSSQISVSNQMSGTSTITVTGQNPTDLITVYNASNQVLGTATVNAGGTAVVSATLTPTGGTIGVTAKRGTAESTRTSVTYSAAVLSAVPSSSINVQNNYGNSDTITVSDISAGDLVTVYASGTSIGTATANSSGVATVTAPLTATGGTVNVTRTRSGVESASTAVTYGAETVPPIASANVSIANSYGGTSTVTVNNLKVGSIVTVSSGATVLATGTATSATLVLPVVLDATGGSLNVSVKEGLLQSATTTLTYPSITVPAIASANIQVNNNSGNADTVSITGQVAGDVITVYDGSGVLGTGTVNAQGSVSVPVTLTPLGGSINVSVKHNEVESPATAVAYLAEVVTPLLSNQISLGSIVNGQIVVTVNGLTAGDLIRVYGAGEVLGTATATATGSVAIPVRANAQGGSLNVSLTRNGIESLATSAMYGSIVVDPVLIGDVTITNNAGDSDTVVVRNQTAGNIVTAYAGGSVLGTGTVASNGTATVNVKLNPLGGSVSVSITSQGVESAVLPVAYVAEVVPPLTAASINVKNNSGNDDTVSVSGLTSGDVIKVYGNATLLGTETVAAGSASVSVPVTLIPVGGSVSVTLTRNGVESVPTLTAYVAEVVNAIPAERITVTTAIGASASVAVDQLQEGDIVNVYADGTLLSTGTANAQGDVQLEVSLSSNGGMVSVTLVRNGIESVPTLVNYDALLVPSIVAQNVNPQNNYGDEDIVTVTEASEGMEVIVYGDDDTVLGTATVPASLQVSISATLIPTGGTIYVSQRYLGIESDKVAVQYAAEVVPPIPANLITINNISGTQDTVGFTSLVAGDLITIYENGAVLDTGTVAANGTLSLAVKLQAQGGILSITRTHNTIQSAATIVNYDAEPGPILNADSISLVNNTGNNDSASVKGLQPGDTIRILGADDTVLGTAIADSTGTVNFQLQLLPAGGVASVILIRAQLESTPVPVTYPAEPAAPIDSPQAAVDSIQGDQGTITVTGMQAGTDARVYDQDDALLGNATADGGGKAVVTFKFLKAQGKLFIRVLANGTETTISTFDYQNVVIEPAPDTTQAVLTDIVGAQGTVTITGAQAGDVLKVYGPNGNVLGTAIADSLGGALITFTFPTADGQLVVTSTRTGGNGENEVTTLDYSGVDIPAIPQPIAALTNITGNQGTVTASNLAAGQTVTVYDDNNAVLGTATAGANGEAIVAFVFPTTDGTLTVVANINGTDTEIASLPYSAIQIPTTPSPQAALGNINGNQGVVTVTGAAAGQTVRVYGADNVQLAEVTADGNGAAVLPLIFTTADGTLSVRTVSNGVETEISTLPYSDIDLPTVDPAAVISDINGAAGTVTVTDAQPGDIVKVYGPNNTVLGTATANGTGTAVIDFTFTTADGTLTVTYTRGGTETEITTLPYSGVDIPATPQPIAALTNISGNQGTVTASNLTAGQTVTVYDDNNAVLGTATAGTNGEAIIAFVFPTTDGTLTVVATINGTDTEIATLPYSGIDIPATPTPEAALGNIDGDQGVVTVTGVTAGQTVRVYSDANVQLAELTADGNGAAVLPVTLPGTSGELSIRTVSNGTETEIAVLPYSGITPPTPTPAAVISDINGAAGTVTVTDAQPGDIVKVYGPNNTVLGTATANGTGTAVIDFTFTTADGTLTVTYTRGGTEAEITTLPYSGVDIPATPQPIAALTNISGDQGTVTASNLTAGQTVTVYDDNNAVLGTATAGTNGEAIIAFVFPTTDGTLTVVATINGTDTEIATLPYSGIDIPATPTPEAALGNIDGDQGVVTVTGVTAGQTVRVYSDANVQLAELTADGNGAAVLPVTLPGTSGELSIRTVSNGTETEIAVLPYSGITPPTPTPTATISDINGADGVVTVTSVQQGDIVTVYGPNNEVLGTATANSTGTAVIDFTFTTTDGTLTVTYTRGGTETEITTLPYSGVDIPTTPQPTAALTDINGDQGTVTASNLTAGQTVTVYDDNNAVLGTATAGTNGEATITFTFPTTDGTLTVVVTINGTDTEIATLPYSGIDIPANPTPTAALTDIDGDQGTVTATNVVAGQTVRVYSDTNVQLAEGTANANGTAVLTFTFPTADGELSVRTVSNGTETEISILPYSGIDIPANPTPTAALTDIDGDQGTVTATNVAAGQTVRVYSDTNVQLAEGTANANGTAVLTFTFPTTDGELSVRTVSNGTETEIATLPYSGVDIPTTPAPSADLTNVTNDQGTVTVTGATVGQTVRVYSDTNVQLAEGTADANGNVTLTFTFPSSDGTLSVRTVSNGAETEIGSLPYSGVVIPETPQPTAELTDTSNGQGTVTVTGLAPQQIARVYSDANVQLAENAANNQGTAVLTFAFPSSSGTLSVRSVSNGVETELNTLSYSGVVVPGDPGNPDNPQATLINSQGNQGTVRVNGVLTGDTVTVQSSVYGQGTVELANVTVDADGIVDISVQFPESSGQLVVTLNRGGTTTTVGTISYNTGGGNTGGDDDDDSVPANRIPGQLGWPYGTDTTGTAAGTGATPAEETNNGTTPAETTTPTTSGNNDVEAASTDGTEAAEELPSGINLTNSDVSDFIDTAGHWAQSDIARLHRLGIVQGIGGNRYAPNATLTRAQFAQMVSNMLQLNASGGAAGYSDVRDAAWYNNAIKAATASGLTDGYTDGSYKPNQKITREEMTHIISNTLRYLDSEKSYNTDADKVLSSYNDRSKVGNWARNDLALAIDQGLIKGRPGGTIDPKANTTRGEAATILARLLDQMNDKFNIK
ncbi:S-layer homology domain-containing protein [Paenibacillus kandeliae]|uniref:S-layer homology domain-containing protein n=1 Tax=Paenibacillus kandeliae TaxID=3231269 RepID=UPI003457B9F4